MVFQPHLLHLQSYLFQLPVSDLVRQLAVAVAELVETHRQVRQVRQVRRATLEWQAILERRVMEVM